MPLAGGAIASVHVNWLSPTKIRQMVIGGSRKTVVWDDLNPQQRLCGLRPRCGSRRSTVLAGDDRPGRAARRERQLPAGRHVRARPCPSERRSARWSRSSRSPSTRAGRLLTDGRAGLRVLSVLEAATESQTRAGGMAAVGRCPVPRRGPAARSDSASGRRHERARAAPASSSPAGRARSGRPSSTSCSTPASNTWTSSTTSSAGDARTSPAALPSGRVQLVEGDLRDRDLVHDLTRASDLVFHQAAIRITQCAEEPRLALEVLVDGTFNVVEAAAEHKVDKLVLASSASVYGLAEAFPTDERHHHHNNDTFYGAAKSFNEGMARSFRAMHGLDYVALRYFNVYGPRMDVHGLYTEVLVRWMERIADGLPPLIFGDGSQTMDFVYTADIARANVLAAMSDVREGVYNIASGTETSLLGSRRGVAPSDGLRRSAWRMGRTAPSTASPAARRRQRQPAETSVGARPRIWRRGCASSSTGGARSGRSVRAGRGRWDRR